MGTGFEFGPIPIGHYLKKGKIQSATHTSPLIPPKTQSLRGYF
jgi:hypothetical protein